MNVMFYFSAIDEACVEVDKSIRNIDIQCYDFNVGVMMLIVMMMLLLLMILSLDVVFPIASASRLNHVDDTITNVSNYDYLQGFGKELLKTLHVSPDGFVQVHGRCC